MGQFLSRLHLNPSIEDLSDEDFQEHILSFTVSNDIIKEEIEAFSVPRRTRKRRKSCAVFSDTTWRKMLDDPETADRYSFWGKKFRRRFRVPFAFFKDILVPLCKEGNTMTDMFVSRRLLLYAYYTFYI